MNRISWRRWLLTAAAYLAIAWVTLRLVSLEQHSDRLTAGWAATTLCWLLVVVAFGARRPRSLGVADGVTLLRLALACSLAGAVAMSFGSYDSWSVAALAVVVTTLDGLDGVVARRRGEASAAGGRLDMNADSAVLTVLCVAAVPALGIWVLLICAMRLLFWVAGRIRPTLRGPLPPSTLRRIIGIAQLVALISVLVPAVPVELAAVLTVTALALLIGSFGRDVRYRLLAGS